ncbi:O-antigen ligase family protein [Hymenobacter setariae]|uniref:O-antigen ligase family protein n=1 Tax=Hymenobacter setariae TaxID=2594794 RepID=A0A558BXK0_9BACT|nr:O-antigen ligase family protein [Hymenobacter setariae]TVT41247.1 O-antigen ligase family protein [Hymenobacter setariae]
MWTFFSEARVRRLSVFFGIVIIAGIFLSAFIRILPSIGIAGLFLTGVGYSLAHKRIAQRAQWPVLGSFILIYLLHAATGIWACFFRNGSGELLLQDLVLQLPLLLLPLSFLLLPTWHEQQRITLWVVLIGCCLLSALGSTVNYFIHYEQIDQGYVRSQVMPTVPDYIRFSLLISMSVLAGAMLLFQKALPAGWRWPVAGAIVLLFIFQHLLAVRSGLLTMYAGGVLLLGWLGWQPKHRKTLLLLITSLAVVAGICLQVFPTLQNRVVNTRYDTELLNFTDAANNHSITARFYSYKVAWIIISEYPIAGVSKIKLDEAVAEQYGYMYPEIEVAHYLLPHNQFLYNLAAYGIVGLLFFLIAFYYPLWVGLRTKNVLLILIYTIVSISFLVEYTLETQIGVLTGIFFILLALIPTTSSRPTATRLAQR